MPPGNPNWSIPIAVATEASPATAPTERSISPVREHERHRHRHHGDDRGLADDVEKVVGIQEALVPKRRGEKREI